MAQFREYLEREGVEVEPPIALPLFVWANEQFLSRGLVVPRPPAGRDFAVETMLVLEPDPTISVQVDLSVRVQSLASMRWSFHTADVRAGQARRIPPESLSLVDWHPVYLDLLAYKERKGLNNLVIRPETPRQIIEKVSYTLVADEAVVCPRSFAGRALLQQTVTQLLCRYVDRFYQARREPWEEQTLAYRPVDLDDPNLAFNRPSVQEKKAAYTVRASRSRADVVEAIERLRQDMEKVYRGENDNLPRIFFDRHLYLPLLLTKGDVLSADPPAVNESEAQFVRDLRDDWNTEKDHSLAGKEIFLLRNLTRGRAIGFFEERGFYPDFILWLLDQETKAQRIVFIEPHGMLHAKAYIHDEKARLWERLPALAEEIGKRNAKTNVLLDAYIISATPDEELHLRYDDGTRERTRFMENHILFRERGAKYDYMRELFVPLTRFPTRPCA